MEVVGRLARTIALSVSLAAVAAASGEAASTAGLHIVNTAVASYVDSKGSAYAAQSNTVVVAVVAVGAIVVSPKETAVNPQTESYPVGTPITRTFTILNAGNLPDAYTITAAAASPGVITAIAFAGSGAPVPASLNTTVSPTVAPGATIAVQLTISTAGIGTNAPFAITLTARSNASTANGLVSDSGREWADAMPAAILAGMSGPKSTVSKLVNNEPSAAVSIGQTVNYSIGFENYGGAAATNAVLTDDVPSGITPLPATVALNGANVASAATLSGQMLIVKVGTVPPGVPETLTFDAVVTRDPLGSTYVNVASLSADGTPAAPTMPASVFVGAADVVYDGFAGASTRIAQAKLTLRDAVTGAVMGLPQSGGSGSNSASPSSVGPGGVVGLPPNTANANPYVTGADGGYSFVFASNQLGSPGKPAQYELDISAPGYNSRRIGIALTPESNGVLYDASLRSLDGQMIAVAGGFALTASNVTLSDVFGLLGNIPMFAPHPLSVTKSVDRDVASGGDRLLYTLQFGTPGIPLGATRVVDTLPPGAVYAPGSARLDGTAAEPVRTGRVLTWTLPALATQHTIVYAAVVMPTVTEGTTLVNQVDVIATTATGGTISGTATADTSVIAGPLGNRIVITGRVFADIRATGRFTPGDHGLPGVRVYLEDGEYVVTDPNGRFTFPAVHPGEHVLRVDASTLPPTVRPYDDHRFDSERSLERLLHGIFDAGLMQDVNFAVKPAS